MHISIGSQGNPGHSSKRRVRPPLLPAAFIDAHADFEQPRTMCLHEPQFRLVVDVSYA